MRLPLARRYVAGIHGMDITRFRDKRLRKVTTLNKQRNRSGSGAWALNYLKNRRNPLEFALIPDI